VLKRIKLVVTLKVCITERAQRGVGAGFLGGVTDPMGQHAGTTVRV